MPHGNRTTLGEHYLLPHAHFLIGWRWVPVHKGNPQIAGWRSRDRHGHYVLLTRAHKWCYVEFVSAVCAHDFIRARNFFPVNPNFPAIVDSAKSHPYSFAVELFRNLEFLAVPPRNGIRAVLRHVLIREFRTDGVFHSRH